MSARFIHPCIHEDFVGLSADGSTAPHVAGEGIVAEHMAADEVASPIAAEHRSIEQSSALTAHLIAVDENGKAWVDLGGEKGLVPASIGFAVTRAQLDELVARKAQVIARMSSGSWQLEAITGVVLPPAMPAEQLNQHLTVEADADGHRIRLCAEHEIVLACGKASITLRANGRVIIKGAQVESYALGTNRIKGGQVRIN